MTPIILLMYALFSSSFSVGKILLTYVSPIFLVGIRMIPAGIILIGYQLVRHKKLPHFNRREIFLYAQVVVLGIYAAYIFRFWGLRDLASSKTALLFNASPFFTAIYSYIFFNEKITFKQWIGLIIGFVGLIPILLTSSAAEQKMGEFFYLSWAEIAILIAVGLHSYGWIVVRQLVKHRSHSPAMINGITMLFGGLLALITAPFIEEFKPISHPAHFLGWLSYVIIVSNIICYNLYGYLMKHYTATFISFAGFVVPLFAGFYGWSFLDEKITWHFYLSCAIVFVGLYLFYQDELKNNAAIIS
jgi:drug/metabolite transporter (DMT)-like permease